MTNRDILSIALKTAGIVFLVYAVSSLPSAIYTAHMYLTNEIAGLKNPQWAAATTAAYTILNILAACFLISWSNEISKRLIPTDSKVSITQLHGNEPTILSLALRIIGIIMVARSIPALLQNVMIIVLGAYKLNNNSLANLFMTATSGAWAREWSVVIGETIALAIGICLISCAKQISDYILRNRTNA